jgi:hypothetical protein
LPCYENTASPQARKGKYSEVPIYTARCSNSCSVRL